METSEDEEIIDNNDNDDCEFSMEMVWHLNADSYVAGRNSYDYFTC